MQDAYIARLESNSGITLKRHAKASDLLPLMEVNKIEEPDNDADLYSDDDQQLTGIPVAPQAIHRKLSSVSHSSQASVSSA